MSSLVDKADEYPQPIKGHISHKEWEKQPFKGVFDENNTSYPNCDLTEEVVKDLREKSAIGLDKYGVTMDRDDLTELEWTIHHYQELLDAVKYVKKRIIVLQRDAGNRA